MCRKNFENRFINKNLTSKNVFDYGFLHGEIVSKGSHYFPEKIKSCKILLNIYKTNTKLKEKLTRGPNVWIKLTNLPESKVKDVWIISLAYAKSLVKNIFGH